MPSCRSGSGLVAPVRVCGLASRGSIGVRTSVRRDLIGRIPDVPTGVLLLGRLGIAMQLGIGEKGYELLYSCTHKRGIYYYIVVHTIVLLNLQSHFVNLDFRKS